LGIQLERKVGKVRNWSLILPQGLGQASRLCYRHSGEGRNPKMSQVYDNCRFQPSHYLPACAGMTMEVLYVQRHYSGDGWDSSKYHFRTASSFCPACWIPACAGMTRGSLPTPSFPCIR